MPKEIIFKPLLFNLLSILIAIVILIFLNDGWGVVLLGVLTVYLLIAIPIFSIWYSKFSLEYTKSIYTPSVINASTPTLMYVAPFIPALFTGGEEETIVYGFILFAYIFIITFLSTVWFKRKKHEEQEEF